jgi:D-alanyl-D-alanine carboxypeptidase/D-alanyl-D-alanine-endopeptidase (penicillin-binding protein 4)
MTHHLKRSFAFSSSILTGLLIWFGAVDAACGETLDAPGRLTMLSKTDRAALTQAALNPDTGILVTDDQGRVLFSRNPDTPRVPASTIKILTSLAALDLVGEDYRFTTLAGYDPDNRILYLKGLGDPLFVSEAIRDFCRQLTQTIQMPEVKKIVIDQTWFDPDITIPGTGRSLNPYDATTGALCANFNTIQFTRDPVKQTFVSAEPQTPLLEMFIPDIRKTGLNQGRILLDTAVRKLYPGLLMAYFLKELGVDVFGPVETGSFPDTEMKISGGPPVRTLTLISPWTLEEVVEKLLTYSNNFIANQIMLTLGAHRYGPPATLDKGRDWLTQFSEERLGWKGVQIAEGSGLSRNMHVTPVQMGRLLLAFMPHHRLLPSTATQYYKTGTLTGIRNRAGYFMGIDGRLYPFVIMGSVPYF